jgi:hypothetical protein
MDCEGSAAGFLLMPEWFHNSRDLEGLPRRFCAPLASGRGL